MLLIPEQLVRQSITPEECLLAVEEGFRLHGHGRIDDIQARLVLQEGDAAVHLYAAHVPGYGLAAKVLRAFEENPKQGLPYIYATVLVLDPATGSLDAILDGGYLTALRTAAATALAARYLARPDGQVLGILGTGLQARTHLLCHLATRRFEHVVIWGRTPEHVEAYLNDMRPQVTVPVKPLHTPDQVCAVADVLCCTTRSRVPLFRPESIRPGTHINIAGPARPDNTEAPLEILHSNRLFVDAADKFRRLWPPGTAPVVEAELGQVIVGRASGRRSDSESTVFKPVGMAFEDVVSARIVVDRVRRSEASPRIRWEGQRQFSRTGAP